MEITAHTREPIPEAHLTEMAADCGVMLHEVKPMEVKWTTSRTEWWSTGGGIRYL